MRLNVEKVLRQIREEVVRRGGTITGGEATFAEGDFPHWVPTVPPMAIRDTYVLADLLAPSDRAFVEGAYMALLRRRPDPDGLRVNLEQLRSGAMSKIEVLGALRWSQEGVSKGVHVDGLLVPYTLHKMKRKRFIGPALRWALAIAQLSQNAERTRRLEAAHAAETHEMGGLINSISRQIRARLLRLEEQDYGRAMENSQQIAVMRAQIEELSRRLDGEMADLRAELNAQRGRGQDLDALYVAFEEQFRGPAELIRERALPYVEIMREANAGTPDAPIIDLGSGRGDWLEIMREHGLSARGIDSNSVFVGVCALRGLDVIQGDVMDVLRTLPDASVGGITGMHIAEHLPFEVLIDMLDECLRVLRPGGVLALETPNPENAWVGAHLFYMDPTHRNPLPPPTLQWMAQARGFVDVRIERWTIARDIGAPPFVSQDVPGADSINSLIAQARNAPDYAIIARRAA